METKNYLKLNALVAVFVFIIYTLFAGDYIVDNMLVALAMIPIHCIPITIAIYFLMKE